MSLLLRCVIGRFRRSRRLRTIVVACLGNGFWCNRRELWLASGMLLLLPLGIMHWWHWFITISGYWHPVDKAPSVRYVPAAKMISDRSLNRP